MGLISTALQIGRSALMSYQGALQIVGNNISNAGNPGYTRQTPVLEPDPGAIYGGGFQAGAGVTISAVQRNIDEALETRLRAGAGDQSAASIVRQTLGRIEAVLNELTDNDLSSLLQKFFNAFSALQSAPHDASARGLVLTAGESVAGELRRQRSDVLSLVEDGNAQIADLTRQINRLSSEIAALNGQIISAESGRPGTAAALRDQRDARLRELAEIIAIEVRPQEAGAVNVYIGNELLIQGTSYRELTTRLENSGGIARVMPEFADDGATVSIRGGRLEGLVQARDTHARAFLTDLDTFASALIQEVNKVHSQGQGSRGMTSVTGTYGVLDANALLNSDAAGLDLRPRNGTFQITVRNAATGSATTTTIAVDLDGVGAGTSLASLAAAINARVPNVHAAVTPDRRLQILADNGYEFTFGEDGSNVLAALGVNTFFSGRAAQDIGLNPVVSSDPTLLAAGRSNLPGDGSNAAAVARLATNPAGALNGQTLTRFYNALVGKVAASASAARSQEEAAGAVLSSLQAQRESISGVSLDEEAIRLVKFQRAFQGAARYVSVVDGLIDEMLALVK